MEGMYVSKKDDSRKECVTFVHTANKPFHVSNGNLFFFFLIGNGCGR